MDNIIEDVKYKNLTKKHVKEICDFLLDKQQEFSIVANTNATTFKPELPLHIKNNLQEFSLFTLSNYTYSTVVVDEDIISFEAGFGNENFGSVVSVPLESVFQIILDEDILYINPVATVEKFNTIRNEENRSMNVFRNNPNNSRFN